MILEIWRGILASNAHFCAKHIACGLTWCSLQSFRFNVGVSEGIWLARKSSNGLWLVGIDRIVRPGESIWIWCKENNNLWVNTPGFTFPWHPDAWRPMFLTLSLRETLDTWVRKLVSGNEKWFAPSYIFTFHGQQGSRANIEEKLSDIE